MLIPLYWKNLKLKKRQLNYKFRRKHIRLAIFKSRLKNYILKTYILTNFLKLHQICNSNILSDTLDLTNPLNTSILWNFLHEQAYYSAFFKKTTYIKQINAQDVIPKSILPYIMYTTKTVNWRRYKIIHSNEIIEILFVSLWLKNLTMFMKWVRKFFEKDEIKKHRKLFLLLNTLLGKVIWDFNIFLELKGLRTTVKGKFGKAGSVRKSRRYIKRGKCSYTSKNIAMVSQTKTIRTVTGVFSIKLEVFY